MKRLFCICLTLFFLSCSSPKYFPVVSKESHPAWDEPYQVAEYDSRYNLFTDRMEVVKVGEHTEILHHPAEWILAFRNEDLEVHTVRVERKDWDKVQKGWNIKVRRVPFGYRYEGYVDPSKISKESAGEEK